MESLSYSSELNDVQQLIGSRVQIKSNWVGNQVLSKSIPILVLAGHADSQGIAGSGTSGEAVDLNGARPMDEKMSDELFWNLKIRDAVVKIGKDKGLNINSYDPIIRTIEDPNDPSTNWSVGAKHAQKGGYAIEIHFDSYGHHGFGSGLIPALSSQLNFLDESFAKSFGRYPLFFRGGLGAPRRQIRVLEIGKLEGTLEERLRNLETRKETINTIANQVVNTFLIGLKIDSP